MVMSATDPGYASETMAAVPERTFTITSFFRQYFLCLPEKYARRSLNGRAGPTVSTTVQSTTLEHRGRASHCSFLLEMVLVTIHSPNRATVSCKRDKTGARDFTFGRHAILSALILWVREIRRKRVCHGASTQNSVFLWSVAGCCRRCSARPQTLLCLSRAFQTFRPRCSGTSKFSRAQKMTVLGDVVVQFVRRQRGLFSVSVLRFI